MKKGLFVIVILIFSLYLSGCAKNNVNDNVANRNNTNNNLTNVRNNTQKNIGNNQGKMRVADKAADKVTNLPEVDHANIIVTDNNAFVAAKLDRSSRNELTTNIENKISRTVKSVDPDIDHVYISVNPDFYDRMKNYTSYIKNGRPISGFVDEFTNTILRVFPDAR